MATLVGGRRAYETGNSNTADEWRLEPDSSRGRSLSPSLSSRCNIADFDSLIDAHFCHLTNQCPSPPKKKKNRVVTSDNYIDCYCRSLWSLESAQPTLLFTSLFPSKRILFRLSLQRFRPNPERLHVPPPRLLQRHFHLLRLFPLRRHNRPRLVI